MQHWRPKATDGAKFWISCKRPAFLRAFSRLQMIQNERPWCCGAAYVEAGLKIDFENQILAFFDVYFWPFNKSYEKINTFFVISAIIASIWNVFIKFRWHDEKLTIGPCRKFTFRCYFVHLYSEVLGIGNQNILKDDWIFSSKINRLILFSSISKGNIT